MIQNQDIIAPYPMQILQQQNKDNNLINDHNNKQVLKPLNHLPYQLNQNLDIIAPYPLQIL